MRGFLIVWLEAPIESTNRMITGQHPMIGGPVAGITVAKRSYQGQLVHLLTEAWQVLT